MSNLKHLSLEELEAEKITCEKYISYLQSKISGQEERIRWIKKYITDLSAVPLHIPQDCKGDPARNGCDHCEPEHACKAVPLHTEVKVGQVWKFKKIQSMFQTDKIKIIAISDTDVRFKFLPDSARDYYAIIPLKALLQNCTLDSSVKND